MLTDTYIKIISIVSAQFKRYTRNFLSIKIQFKNSRTDIFRRNFRASDKVVGGTNHRISQLILTSSHENSPHDFYSSHVVWYGFRIRVASFGPSSSLNESLLPPSFRPSQTHPLSLFSHRGTLSFGTPLILYSQSIHFRGSPLEFLSFPALRFRYRLSLYSAGIHSSHAISDETRQFSLPFFFYYF